MDTLSTAILGGALAVIMIGMGLSLTGQDFKRILEAPRAVFLGFLAQIILLPLLGLGLIEVLNLEPPIAMGLMILAACPGGPTSNLLSLLAKADLALSVSLTALNSLVTLITIPFLVQFSYQVIYAETTQVPPPLETIAQSLLIVIALPLSIGMLTRKFKPELAKKLNRPVRIASALLLALVIVGLVIKERENFVDYFARAAIAALLLNLLGMGIGLILGKAGRLNLKQQLTIAIESGNQNGTLAIHIAVVTLGMEDLAITAAVYSLIMYATAVIPVSFGMKKFRSGI